MDSMNAMRFACFDRRGPARGTIRALPALLALQAGLVGYTASGATAEQVKQALFRRGEFTIIDVRPSVDYQVAHIPGAINVPAVLCGKKRLPPLGKIFVCGDGLDVETTRAAVRELNRKKGVTAEILEGGFGRWNALNYPTTATPGMTRENIPILTYRQLVRVSASNPDLVLVDLRRPERGGETRTDLAALFPGVRRVASALEDSRRQRSLHSRVYVLIDSLDGRSKEHARLLAAAGIKRFVILPGGEETLKRRGQSERIHIQQ